MNESNQNQAAPYGLYRQNITLTHTTGQNFPVFGKTQNPGGT